MRYLYFALYMLLAFILLPSCNSDESSRAKASLEVVFKATYDGEPLVMSKEYVFQDDETIRFLRNDFLISTLELKGKQPVQLIEVDFIDFTSKNFTLEKAQEGISLLFTELAPGNYEGLGFGLGLTANQNAATPSQFPAGHPLRNAELHWSVWNSYIFARIEGYLRSPSQIGQSGFSYHLGTSELRTQVDRSFPVKLEGGKTTRLIVEMDYKQAFFKDGKAFDIRKQPSTHGLDDIPAATLIMNNFGAGVKITKG